MDSEIPLQTMSSKISHGTLTVLILKTTWIYSEMVPIHTILSPGSAAKAQTADNSIACRSKNITIHQAEAETHFCHSEMVPHIILSPDSAAKTQMAAIIHHSNSTSCRSKNITTKLKQKLTFEPSWEKLWTGILHSARHPSHCCGPAHLCTPPPAPCPCWPLAVGRTPCHPPVAADTYTYKR